MMCRLVIGILVLSTAAAAPVQTPTVTKMLNLFQALQTKHVSFSLTESELNEYLSYALFLPAYRDKLPDSYADFNQYVRFMVSVRASHLSKRRRS
jgi:hypothetical protein